MVPRDDGTNAQMTTFILLSDVTDKDGPTKVVPLAEDARRSDRHQARDRNSATYFDKEVSIDRSGRKPDDLQDRRLPSRLELHRAEPFALRRRSTDFKTRAWRWQGKLAWPDEFERPAWDEAICKMTPRQRDLFGWPPIGSDYWNAQTLRDVQMRYRRPGFVAVSRRHHVGFSRLNVSLSSS